MLPSTSVFSTSIGSPKWHGEHQLINGQKVCERGGFSPTTSLKITKKHSRPPSYPGMMDASLLGLAPTSKRSEKFCWTLRRRSLRDQTVLYADVSRILTESVNILSDRMNPEQALRLASTFRELLRALAQTDEVAFNTGMSFVCNPNIVRIPSTHPTSVRGNLWRHVELEEVLTVQTRATESMKALMVHPLMQAAVSRHRFWVWVTSLDSTAFSRLESSEVYVCFRTGYGRSSGL